MPQHIAVVPDQGRIYGTTILFEMWADGAKVVPLADSTRIGPWPLAGGVVVQNRGNLVVVLRADDGDAADDGTSAYLEPGDSDIFAFQSTDASISMAYLEDELIGEWLGFVHVMPIRGSPPDLVVDEAE